MYDRQKELIKEVGSKFSEINIDNKLSSMFSENGSSRSIDNLTKSLFTSIKKKYDIHSVSYTDFIEDVKRHGTMSDKLKDVLIDFFTEVIHISYRDQTISENEKNDLREKIKIIIKATQ